MDTCILLATSSAVSEPSSSSATSCASRSPTRESLKSSVVVCRVSTNTLSRSLWSRHAARASAMTRQTLTGLDDVDAAGEAPEPHAQVQGLQELARVNQVLRGYQRRAAGPAGCGSRTDQETTSESHLDGASNLVYIYIGPTNRLKRQKASWSVSMPPRPLRSAPFPRPPSRNSASCLASSWW